MFMELRQPWSSHSPTANALTKSGGGRGAPVMLASGQNGPQHIVADATNVYWTNIGSIEDTGTVMTVPIAGGTPTPLAATQRGPLGIAIDATAVYWTDVSRVMKAAKGGGTPVALASGLGRASDVAVDATHVYWTDTDAGTIAKIAK